MDGTIPRHAISEVLERIAELAEQHALRVANVFHAGDGNLHPLVLFDANDGSQLERAEALGAAILETCLAAGGAITGEHGVGIEKIRQMPLQFSDTELSQFHSIRRALDPDQRLNPGKLLPELRHCQEYRALSSLWSPPGEHLSTPLTLPAAGEPPELHALQEKLHDALSDQRPLCIEGNQSKAFLGAPMEGEVLSCRRYTGIIDYSPSELTISVRAGTSLAEVEETLAARGQMLACEPPRFGDASIGGMIGSGLAGPNRPDGGNVADQVLGCRLLNGRGEVMRFGGQVMKNVAGFDVARLMTGSMGCLGLLVELTLRVRPRPAAERSFRFDISPERIAPFVYQCRMQGLPVTASCHDGDALILRFSGSTEEIGPLERTLARHFSFIDLEEDHQSDFWQTLKEHQHEFFRQPRSLWRITLPPAAPPLLLGGSTLIEWHGGLRWLSSDAPAEEVFNRVAEQQGRACLFRPEGYRKETDQGRFQPVPTPVANWYRALKQAFDPDGIFNHGRMYPDL